MPQQKLSLVRGAMKGSSIRRSRRRGSTSLSAQRRAKTYLTPSPNAKVSSRTRRARRRSRVPRVFFETLSNAQKRALHTKFGRGYERLLPGGFHLSRKIGSGQYGITYSLCKSHTECKAVKLQIVKNRAEFDQEVRMQKLFHEHGMAPAVHSVQTYKHKRKTVGVIVMDRVDGVLSSLLQKPLKAKAIDDIVASLVDIIRQMKQLKLTHGDMHYANVAYVYRTDWRGDLSLHFSLIDFGWSCDKQATPEIELVQLLRTLDPSLEPSFNSVNRKYMWKKLLTIFAKTFPRTRMRTYDDADERHETLTRELEERCF